MKTKPSPIWKIVSAQLIAGTLLTILAFLADLLHGSAAGIAALAATAVCVVPGIYLAWMSDRTVPAGSNGIGIALKGEAGRFLLSATGFVLVFVLIKPLNVWVFFGVFGGLQICNIVVPWRDAAKMRHRPDSNGHQ